MEEVITTLTIQKIDSPAEAEQMPNKIKSLQKRCPTVSWLEGKKGLKDQVGRQPGWHRRPGGGTDCHRAGGARYHIYVAH